MAESNTEPSQEPPTPDAIPEEATDAASTHLFEWDSQTPEWAKDNDRREMRTALEAAAPAIQAQATKAERERIVAQIERQRIAPHPADGTYAGEMLSSDDNARNRSIDDCLAAIRSEGDDE